jgi:uncharacterized damage-inducible protein DinB
MISPEYCQLMARYNAWMNERLYSVCAAMAAEERTLDRGAFFGSIHGTLNHTLWADRMWLGRFVGPPCEHPAYGTNMFERFDDLTQARQTTDAALLQWAGNVTPDWLESMIEYRSFADGKARRLRACVAAVHLFNHGTHHRGQLTTLMKQAGFHPGVTDLPWMPGIVEILD